MKPPRQRPGAAERAAARAARAEMEAQYSKLKMDHMQAVARGDKAKAAAIKAKMVALSEAYHAMKVRRGNGNGGKKRGFWG